MTANTTLARLQQLLPQLFQPVDVSGDLYLRCQLTAELPALLPIARVLEALLVPANEISPLPNVPEFTIGMMSGRDRVFCVVDLAQLLGLPPLPMNLQNYQVITIDLSAPGTAAVDAAGMSIGKSLGLAVRRVSGVTRFEAAGLQVAGAEIPEFLTVYQQGYFVAGTERLLVLNADAIASAPNLLRNPFI